MSLGGDHNTILFQEGKCRFQSMIRPVGNRQDSWSSRQSHISSCTGLILIKVLTTSHDHSDILFHVDRGMTSVSNVFELKIPPHAHEILPTLQAERSTRHAQSRKFRSFAIPSKRQYHLTNEDCNILAKDRYMTLHHTEEASKSTLRYAANGSVCQADHIKSSKF